MKVTFAVVQENMHPLADRTDEQVQTPIPIHIRQQRARGVEVCQLQPGLAGDVLEIPTAQVAVQGGMPAYSAEKQVH